MRCRRLKAFYAHIIYFFGGSDVEKVVKGCVADLIMIWGLFYEWCKLLADQPTSCGCYCSVMVDCWSSKGEC